MKLILQQNGTTVTIEREGDGQTGDQMAQLCRELLLGQGYHWDTVTESLPTEEDVVDLIRESLELQRCESFLDKEVDKGCEVFDTLP